VIIPPIEAIQTVDVSTSNHDVVFGRSAGAVNQRHSEVGTNNWHGSAYEFLQNSSFNARSFFNPSVGHMAYNYFGGTAGGPIKKKQAVHLRGLPAVPAIMRRTAIW